MSPSAARERLLVAKYAFPEHSMRYVHSNEPWNRCYGYQARGNYNQAM